MDIKDKSILVLGGWGLVGSAVVRRLVPAGPKRIIVTSRFKQETLAAVASFKEEFPSVAFEGWWGNIFTRTKYKDTDREVMLADETTRRLLLHDIFDDLNDDIVEHSALYKLITSTKPDIIIDCINTATAIAYQDLFSSARGVLQDIDDGKLLDTERVERLIGNMYIPQLIRHIQILNEALQHAHTGMYLKIGTSGTGGMGLNIPYTHSEERPSRVLLGKSTVAGAHTMLLFLMGRTPDAPIVKEIKPTATIGWKRIEYGEVRKQGKPIELVDCRTPISIGSKLRLREEEIETPLGRSLKGVFIDTGENGIFARGEFETVTSLGQMEMVTPEEIAENVLRELHGTNTGKEVVSALDGAVMEPTYRAGVMRSMAIDKLAELEKLHDHESIAFEMLGPPRLSKLLYEAHLLQRVVKSMREIIESDADDIALSMRELVRSDTDLRAGIVSIGIPILLPDGKSLLRANHIKIPPFRGEAVLGSTPAKIDEWAEQGWVDLRAKNIVVWQRRIKRIIDTTRAMNAPTGSEHVRTAQYWNNFESVPVGKLVSWIFAVEDKGERMKP